MPRENIFSIKKQSAYLWRSLYRLKKKPSTKVVDNSIENICWLEACFRTDVSFFLFASCSQKAKNRIVNVEIFEPLWKGRLRMVYIRGLVGVILGTIYFTFQHKIVCINVNFYRISTDYFTILVVIQATNLELSLFSSAICKNHYLNFFPAKPSKWK